MAVERTNVLLTGATGFIGGTVLATLLTSQDERVRKCKLSVMVRGADKAKYFEDKGITPILFNDLEDADDLRKAASQNDVVINCATGFATTAARALIEGLGERQRQTGKKTSIIHTSGTSNLGDKPISRTYIEERFPDRPFADTEDIDAHQRYRESLQQYPQRTTDLVVIDTGAAEKVSTVIMMPPTIWGKGSGHFHRRSMQLPAMCRAALKAKQAVVLGDGTSQVDHVHVSDLAMLYELVLQAVLRDEQFGTGKRGIYFCETGHHSWNDAAEAIGRAGKELGYLDTAEVKHIDLDEAGELLAGNVLHREHIESGFALNALTQTTRAKRFGWEPRYTREDFLNSFHDELGVAHGDHE